MIQKQSKIQKMIEADQKIMESWTLTSQQELIEALNQLIEAATEDLPANPHSKKNERVANGVEREVKDYFNNLEKAFPFEELDKLYYKYVPFEPEEAK